jgi:hypothetical protein
MSTGFYLACEDKTIAVPRKVYLALEAMIREKATGEVVLQFRDGGVTDARVTKIIK